MKAARDFHKADWLYQLGVLDGIITGIVTGVKKGFDNVLGDFATTIGHGAKKPDKRPR